MNRRAPFCLFACLLTITALTIPTSSLGCGPFIQESYLAGQSSYSKIFRSRLAIRRLIADMSDLIPEVPPIADGVSTAEAEKRDFGEAVERALPHLSAEEKAKLIAAYLNGIKDEGPFPELPEALAEFRLYRLGVKEMRERNDVIPPAWRKLLELPPESRHYRTTWAYYMMANFCANAPALKAEAPGYYRACREAARAGFADTPGLVKGSYRNEFACESDPVKKIHVALEAQRNRPDMELLADVYIFKRKTWKSWFSVENYRAMMEDPICRELLAIFDCQDPSFKWGAHVCKFRNADILAWRAYDRGEVEDARRFLELREKDTLLSAYVEALIARHNGNNELAIRKLRQWLEFAARIDPKKNINVVEFQSKTEGGGGSFENQQSEVYGLLGNAMVMRRDFTEAAHFFYRAGQVESDLTYVAEHFMTLEELAAFADSLADDLSSERRRDVMNIRHMTARRAFREGDFALAEKYMPEKYKPFMKQYLAFMQAAEDKTRSGDERALSLYNAAKIMRLRGMELCGTEGCPDNARYGGDYGLSAEREDCPNCRYDQQTDRWVVICPEHWRRRWSYFPDLSDLAYLRAPGPHVPGNQRFHYRYRAAELAMRAGDMATDEDLRALAHLFGGECLRLRTPRKADVFYKRLVKNSPHNAVARIADAIRWFPECPALHQEMRCLIPCGSLAEAKALMEQAANELKEIMAQKEEARQAKEQPGPR